MSLFSTFPRYVLAGVVNTGLGYLVYLGLLQVTNYRIAYAISFVAGMVLSYLLMRFAVFRSAGRRFSPVWVAASQVLQLLLGLGVVEVWVRVLNAPPALAALAAVAVCVPVMFVIQRWIFSTGGQA